jgi:hypothetical protein
MGIETGEWTAPERVDDVGRECLLRVNGAVFAVSRSLPAPDKQTFSVFVGLSQKRQSPKS